MSLRKRPNSLYLQNNLSPYLDALPHLSPLPPVLRQQDDRAEVKQTMQDGRKNMQGGRAEVKTKCQTVEQKMYDGRANKCKAVEQELNKKCKVVEQKKARWLSTKKKDGRADICKMQDGRAKQCNGGRDSRLLFFGHQGIFAFQIFYRGRHILRNKKGIP
jgi:hypothetical protein